MNTKVKLVALQNEWNKVLGELDQEDLKLASYDSTLIKFLGNVSGKKILDYGAGPGVLSLALTKMNAKAKAWDINAEMRDRESEKIGATNVYENKNLIPRNFFDNIICNLVVCIVPEEEVANIARDIKEMLNVQGTAYIGFCNPKIFKVFESNLDFRFPTGHKYEENHDFKKVKKEGGYEIIESHRPIEWYNKIFNECGLKVRGIHFTPEYELKGEKIEDFVLFELAK